MSALADHLKPQPYPYGHLAARLLGKLAGKNRLFLRTPLPPSHQLRMGTASLGQGLFRRRAEALGLALAVAPSLSPSTEEGWFSYSTSTSPNAGVERTVRELLFPLLFQWDVPAGAGTEAAAAAMDVDDGEMKLPALPAPLALPLDAVIEAVSPLLDSLLQPVPSALVPQDEEAEAKEAEAEAQGGEEKEMEDAGPRYLPCPPRPS